MYAKNLKFAPGTESVQKENDLIEKQKIFPLEDIQKNSLAYNISLFYLIIKLF